MPSPAKIAPSETLKTFKYTFPPFPEVPEGVTIVPFEDFQECGIQVDLTGSADDGEVEKDGLGIPTIQLRVKHDTDISKTNPERVRKKEVRGGGFRKEWWEDWAEGEDLRNHGPYDVNVARIDRFHQAATDFQKYRKFPPMSTNVQWLWDQLRIFSGLLASTPVWHKVSDKTAEDADDFDDDFEDDDSGSKSVYQGGPGERRYPPRPRPRAPYDRYGKAATVVEDDEDIRKLLDDARAVKEDKLVVFLDNPARSIQVFLSSYMTYQGIIYADKNLTSAPHLLRFFVNYLLRNKVLPDKTCTRSLQQSLEVIDKAAVELPLTSKLAKVLPDVFGEACQGCWGGRGENALDSGARAAVDADAAFESILKEENVEVIKLGADEGPMPETADAPDNVPETVTAAPETDAAAAASWENNGSAAETDWALPHPSSRPSLLSLLGPTALPLTHAPGIVESSVRRIKSVVMPLEANPNPNASATEDAEAVERVLEGRFARVVMAPWVDWDPESPARILRSSVGAVATPVIAPAVPDVPSSDSAPADADPPLGPGGLKPHALETDDITVLLDPEVARTLCVGIGLSGTWVQLARQVDLPAAAAPAEEDVNEENEAKLEKNPKPKKKKTLTKAQKERRGLRYWYLDEHMMVLPSYWLV